MTNRDNTIDTIDEFEHYEDQFNPMRTDRQARRRRKPRVKYIPKKSQGEVVDEVADVTGVEAGFRTTYQPSNYEAGWLLSSLESFFDQQLIVDVQALVKGGKEANVYRCEGSAVTGETWLAAKVYRPRMFRQLRNDKLYRQGRDLLATNGRPVEEHDARTQRALEKGSAYGLEVTHTSWLMHEYTTLQRLHNAGAAVPRPIAASENAILMSYHGDEHMPAPTLNQVQLDPDEVRPLFEDTIRSIDLMLVHGLIHGDLSAYNILYWEGEITLIDFPQVVDLHRNGSAYFILQRDITRICEYFTRQGIRHDPQAIMDSLWGRYVEQRPDDVIADLSRMLDEA
ncbi:MAG: hypothetical protein JW966_02945 [Anaerolineae bacterium]|nr:hypothetical protein [Anaerolineae bacterium]